MAEALLATKSRKPVLFTRDDHQLLCGPNPITADALLASIEASSGTSGLDVISQSTIPSVMKFLASLSLRYAIISRLFECVDAVLLGPPPTFETPFSRHHEGHVRHCAYGLDARFTGLTLGLYREFEFRAQTADSAAPTPFERARMDLMYLPATHYAPIQWHTVRGYAEFALAEAEATPLGDPERLIVGQLGRMCYSLDLSAPTVASLVERIDRYINHATDASLFFDSSRGVADMYLLPLDGGS
ncbi:hypothetical protein C8R43DRAFT_1127396 [Mycena crocata]|nr:hypothetical protein C8R43DRAFT_1127396 [Mycena crocata]